MVIDNWFLAIGKAIDDHQQSIRMAIPITNNSTHNG